MSHARRGLFTLVILLFTKDRGQTLQEICVTKATSAPQEGMQCAIGVGQDACGQPRRQLLVRIGH